MKPFKPRANQLTVFVIFVLAFLWATSFLPDYYCWITCWMGAK